MRGHRDLERVCAAAIVCALVAALVPWEVVRLIAALPLAIFLTGYAITAAAFGSQRLDMQRLTMLTLLCGLSVLCLGGIVLNFLPGGLRTVTWALLLVLVIFAAARTAALRRAAPARGGTATDRRRPAAQGPRMRKADLACGGLALAVAVAALVFAYTPLPADKAVGYTALWMLPGDDASGPSVRVGVISAEQEAESYRLEVRVREGEEPSTYRLALDPGEERVFRVPLELEAGRGGRVVASLYDTTRPGELYRRVTAWAPSGPQAAEG